MTAPRAAGEVEGLAEYFHGRFNASAVDETECFHMSKYRRCEAAARSLLASDWLAERDARVVAEALRDASEDPNARLSGHSGVSVRWLRDRADRLTADTRAGRAGEPRA